jgi:hypothetical protein
MVPFSQELCFSAGPDSFLEALAVFAVVSIDYFCFHRFLKVLNSGYLSCCFLSGSLYLALYAEYPGTYYLGYNWYSAALLKA